MPAKRPFSSYALPLIFVFPALLLTVSGCILAAAGSPVANTKTDDYQSYNANADMPYAEYQKIVGGCGANTEGADADSYTSATIEYSDTGRVPDFYNPTAEELEALERMCTLFPDLDAFNDEIRAQMGITTAARRVINTWVLEAGWKGIIPVVCCEYPNFDEAVALFPLLTIQEIRDDLRGVNYVDGFFFWGCTGCYYLVSWYSILEMLLPSLSDDDLNILSRYIGRIR